MTVSVLQTLFELYRMNFLFSDLYFEISFLGWYFTTVLLTTVGYGDIVPYTKGGKLFATVYILVAGTILLHNMSMISMIPLELRRRRTELAVLNQVRTFFSLRLSKAFSSTSFS